MIFVVKWKFSYAFLLKVLSKMFRISIKKENFEYMKFACLNFDLAVYSISNSLIYANGETQSFDYWNHTISQYSVDDEFSFDGNVNCFIVLDF